MMLCLNAGNVAKLVVGGSEFMSCDCLGFWLEHKLKLLYADRRVTRRKVDVRT